MVEVAGTIPGSSPGTATTRRETMRASTWNAP